MVKAVIMHKILLLPGDGIGPEIMEQGKKILGVFNDIVSYEEAFIGGAAIDKFGMPYPTLTAEKALKANAVLLGAVGGPIWDALPLSERPEKGLLAIRKDLGLYANLRPLDIWPSLIDFSPLKKELLENVSFVIVRELTGDLYFGEPRGITQTHAWNTMIYTRKEIARVAHIAFQLAQKRNRKICSIDKANVLETMVLWRNIVNEVHKSYPDVTLQHMYVDNAAMQIIRRPAEFDVMLTSNMFGDILSDESAVLSGSLGLLPSASLGDKQALYEPIHGSAPDIAGRGIANPIGLILSIAMMFELSFRRPDLAAGIKQAVGNVLTNGYRTQDIYSENMNLISTDEMGNQIMNNLTRVLSQRSDFTFLSA